jgi:uncharacterized protein (UPF0147 family)
MKLLHHNLNQKSKKPKKFEDLTAHDVIKAKIPRAGRAFNELAREAIPPKPKNGRAKILSMKYVDENPGKPGLIPEVADVFEKPKEEKPVPEVLPPTPELSTVVPAAENIAPEPVAPVEPPTPEMAAIEPLEAAAAADLHNLHPEADLRPDPNKRLVTELELTHEAEKRKQDRKESRQRVADLAATAKKNREEGEAAKKVELPKIEPKPIVPPTETLPQPEVMPPKNEVVVSLTDKKIDEALGIEKQKILDKTNKEQTAQGIEAALVAIPETTRLSGHERNAAHELDKINPANSLPPLTPEMSTMHVGERNAAGALASMHPDTIAEKAAQRELVQKYSDNPGSKYEAVRRMVPKAFGRIHDWIDRKEADNVHREAARISATLDDVNKLKAEREKISQDPNIPESTRAQLLNDLSAEERNLSRSIRNPEEKARAVERYREERDTAVTKVQERFGVEIAARRNSVEKLQKEFDAIKQEVASFETYRRELWTDRVAAARDGFRKQVDLIKNEIHKIDVRLADKKHQLDELSRKVLPLRTDVKMMEHDEKNLARLKEDRAQRAPSPDAAPRVDPTPEAKPTPDSGADASKTPETKKDDPAAKVEKKKAPVTKPAKPKAPLGTAKTAPKKPKPQTTSKLKESKDADADKKPEREKTMEKGKQPLDAHIKGWNTFVDTVVSKDRKKYPNFPLRFGLGSLKLAAGTFITEPFKQYTQGPLSGKQFQAYIDDYVRKNKKEFSDREMKTFNLARKNFIDSLKKNK